MGNNCLVKDEVSSLVRADVNGNIIAAENIPYAGLDTVQSCLNGPPAVRRRRIDIVTDWLAKRPTITFELEDSEFKVAQFVNLGISLLPSLIKSGFNGLDKGTAVSSFKIAEERKSARYVSMHMAVDRSNVICDTELDIPTLIIRGVTTRPVITSPDMGIERLFPRLQGLVDGFQPLPKEILARYQSQGSRLIAADLDPSHKLHDAPLGIPTAEE
jgi:hypothetical protein